MVMAGSGLRGEVTERQTLLVATAGDKGIFVYIHVHVHCTSCIMRISIKEGN